MRIGFHSIKVHNVLTEIRYDSTEINKIRYDRTAFMLSRVRGERVMADMVQDNLCCSRSVVDWAKVTRSLLGAVSFPVIGLLVPYGMSKQGIHDIFPYFFHRNRHCEPASLQGERQRYVIDAENASSASSAVNLPSVSACRSALACASFSRILGLSANTATTTCWLLGERNAS